METRVESELTRAARGVDLVTGRRCLISCAPVKYVNGDAFPVRVLASPLD